MMTELGIGHQAYLLWVGESNKIHVSSQASQIRNVNLELLSHVKLLIYPTRNRTYFIPPSS